MLSNSSTRPEICRYGPCSNSISGRGCAGMWRAFLARYLQSEEEIRSIIREIRTEIELGH